MMSRKGLCALAVLGFIALGSGTAQAQDVETVLRLKERVSMEKLAQDVTDPSSPRYRNFYSPRRNSRDRGSSGCRLQRASFAS